ncbi:hypothetical protein CERZMDRAFT_88064 [Cercospora zeae-maydis SCOH1-5]|uniref:Uncharacterized protein n=1 Tax=Cercospora zeae-maydis SCOH1-5 TaxID=717836 RepID=A0A6A6F0H5_9PEZI|nr:hypothetical protein CERZMDRAFT_88064 [Cercospora zeae-maydis SCOH1-5]
MPAMCSVTGNPRSRRNCQAHRTHALRWGPVLRTHDHSHVLPLSGPVVSDNAGFDNVIMSCAPFIRFLQKWKSAILVGDQTMSEASLAESDGWQCRTATTEATEASKEVK